MGWWGGAWAALTTEELVAELSYSPAVLGRQDMIAIPCIHRLGWHSGFAAGPRFFCLAFESPRSPRLPSLHRPPRCPLMSARCTLSNPPWCRQMGKWMLLLTPPPLPRLEGKPLSISIWNADGGRTCWQNLGRRVLSSPSSSPEKPLSNKNCFHHHCLKPGAALIMCQAGI